MTRNICEFVVVSLQVMGYERPMYFSDPKQQSMDLSGLMGLAAAGPPSTLQSGALSMAKLNTFYQPPWFDKVEKEFVASREACSLSDFSSFAKMEIWSSHGEVVDFLQRMCSDNIDINVGE